MNQTSVFSLSQTPDWRSIIALNLVSALAQVAQFGICFVVLPVWLSQHGADTLQLSLFAASLWLGQLPGLAWAPALCRRHGAKAVILVALACTVFALGIMASGRPTLWLLGGLLGGLGQGLRWIGLEPWLYQIAPGHAKGRLVGFHETLIALAPIVAPVLSTWVGFDGNAPLLLGMGFACVAAIPLVAARSEPSEVSPDEARAPAWRLPKEAVFKLGVAMAFLGGMSEAAFMGMFPVFAEGRRLGVDQAAALLSAFGLGGVLFQYVAGWLADHRGMRFTCLVSCICTALLTIALSWEWSLPVMHAAIFCLGGLVTAYLTLALVACAKMQSGSLSENMRAISMVYTFSAVGGPLLGGWAVVWGGGTALMWTLAALSAGIAAALGAVGIRSRRT